MVVDSNEYIFMALLLSLDMLENIWGHKIEPMISTPPPTGPLSLFNLYVTLSCSQGCDNIWLLQDFDNKWFKKPWAQ